jgi:hypothetical protein
MRIRDEDSSDPGWKKVGSGIPDPQQCFLLNVPYHVIILFRILFATVSSRQTICAQYKQKTKRRHNSDDKVRLTLLQYRILSTARRVCQKIQVRFF